MLIEINKTEVKMSKSGYQKKVSTQEQNQYLYHLTDPGFQGVNRLFVLSFANEANRRGDTGYYLPKLEIEDYNFLIDTLYITFQKKK